MVSSIVSVRYRRSDRDTVRECSPTSQGNEDRPRVTIHRLRMPCRKGVLILVAVIAISRLLGDHMAWPALVPR